MKIEPCFVLHTPLDDEKVLFKVVESSFQISCCCLFMNNVGELSSSRIPLSPNNNPPVCSSNSTEDKLKVSSQSSLYKSSSDNNKKLRLFIKSEFCCCLLFVGYCTSTHSFQYRNFAVLDKITQKTQQSTTHNSPVVTNSRSIWVTSPDTSCTVLLSVLRSDRRRRLYACPSTHSCARSPTCNM